MIGIVIGLLLVALVAGAFLLWRRPRPQLPPADQERRRVLAESPPAAAPVAESAEAAREPGAEAPEEAEPAPAPPRALTPAAAPDDLGPSEIVQPLAGAEVAAPPSAPSAAAAAAPTPSAAPPPPPAASLVTSAPGTVAPARRERTADAPSPPATARPLVTRPPRPSAPPTAAPRPTQQRPAAAPVPLPVDKPAVATRDQREALEIAAKKSERERYREGLTKTRKGFIARLAGLLRGKPKVDRDLKDEIEEVLLTADIGAKAADRLLAKVTEVLDRDQVADPGAVWAAIRELALEILDIEARPLDYAVADGPYTLLMIGVNGVGKTTTLGKLAARHVEAGRRVLLVAGDTFRAAAAEQLEVWSRRAGCDIYVGKEGADPSSVIFDGIMHGRKQGYDVVLCDTAGRLHTRKELMAELEKIRRSADKALSKGREPVAAHDTFLVLDATIGQNALAQATLFKETMDFSGLVLTKLDGTAKGGVVLGVCDELRVPIRYIGIGEGVDDLRSFDPAAFCDALFTPDATTKAE